jgi:hypothetical protein
MKKRAAVWGVLIGLLAGLGVTGPTQAQAAVSFPADLGFTGTVAPVEGNATLPDFGAWVIRHNLGPKIANGWITTETWAPSGTRLYGIRPSSDCQVNAAKTYRKCRTFGQIWLDGHDNQPAEGLRILIALTLVSKSILTCGKIKISYAEDPNPANNVAYFRVTKGGQPTTCFPKPKPVVKPKPSPSAKASSQASAAPSLSPSVTVPPSDLPTDPSASDLPAVLVADPAGTGFGSTVVIGAGALLIVLGGGILWLVRRRREAHIADISRE